MSDTKLLQDRECRHPRGFEWNGLGSQFGSNKQCPFCGVYESDAKP